MCEEIKTKIVVIPEFVFVNLKYLTCRKQARKWKSRVFKSVFEVVINMPPASGPAIYSEFFNFKIVRLVFEVYPFQINFIPSPNV